VRYTSGTGDEVFDSIEAVVKGLGMGLVELSVSHQKSGVQVRAVICKGSKQGVDEAGGAINRADKAAGVVDKAAGAADRADEAGDVVDKAAGAINRVDEAGGFVDKAAGAINRVDKAAGFEQPVVGIDDCARVHRAIMPRLELAFPKRDIHVEVSSPGIDRRIKDGAEFVHYIGRPVSCYRTDISGWTSGILVNAGDTHIVIKGKNGMTSLSYGVIAKAKLASFASIAPETEAAV
jgi:ribosome maturation factor RimP